MTLLNSESTQAFAAAFAERLLREAPHDPTRYAVLCAYSRAATENETTELNGFLTEQQLSYVAAGDAHETAERKALQDLCQMLLASNEFVYLN